MGFEAERRRGAHDFQSSLGPGRHERQVSSCQEFRFAVDGEFDEAADHRDQPLTRVADRGEGHAGRIGPRGEHESERFDFPLECFFR